MSQTVTVIDYGMGNIQSVLNALNFLGFESKLSSNPEDILNSEILILPGVGAFRKAMESLQNLGLDDAIKVASLERKTKILGICLGMQLFAESSSEDGYTEGLGLISGHVERFTQAEVLGNKIPHVGFDQVWVNRESRLMSNVSNGSDFYFVHAYRLLNSNVEGIPMVCNYGSEFLAAYENGNIFATQFHPEKSQTNGLKLLSNFLEAK